MVIIITVNEPVAFSREVHAKEVVQTEHGIDHLDDHHGTLLECGEQTAPPAREDAEGVLHHHQDPA